MIQFSRIKISTEATNALKMLKARTGLTPNLLCRIALCYSLENCKINEMIPTNDNGQEFNRHTLLGDNDVYYIALVKERCAKDKLDPEQNLLKQMKLHINNGVMVISGRVKNLSDLTNLLK